MREPGRAFCALRLTDPERLGLVKLAMRNFWPGRILRSVQRIYLDQNKWIALARARAGHKEEAHLIEVLEAAHEAVGAGDASFPLSAQHYYETHLRGDPASRMHLALTMLDLSQYDAIAPPHVLVPYEIEVALIRQLQLPNDPPHAVQIFGKGANHVFN